MQSAIHRPEINVADGVLRKNLRLSIINIKIFPVHPIAVNNNIDIVRIDSRVNISKNSNNEKIFLYFYNYD